MEIHQLRYFLAVARAGRITQAARVCNVSQPSLSIQLRKLEDELGGPLFNRTRRRVILTARGELFMPHARAVLDHMEAAHREVESLAELATGSVTIGCLPTTGAHVLPRVLAAYRKAYPGIRVQLREESTPRLAQCLEEGEMDLAIMDDGGLRPSLDHLVLFTEELLLALPPRHPLAGRTRLHLKQVAGKPFILMKPGHGFRQITLDLLHKAGVEPQVVFESGAIETLQALVEAGLGVSLVPQMVRRPSGIAYVAVSQPRATRTLILAWRRKATLSPAAAAMRRNIQNFL